jgi:hypothetical protein
MTRLIYRTNTVISRAHKGVVARRADRASRRALRRDLQSYNTDAEISDLLAGLDAAHGTDADVVRSIVLSQRAAGTGARLAS